MDLFEERAKSLTPVKVESVDPFEQRAAQFSTAPQEGGIVPSFKRGLQSGVSGLLTGQQATPTPQDQPWLEHLAQLGGQLASDIPAMTAGSVGGTIAGAPLGPVGSLVGAGAGAFAAPTAIKEAFNEYRQFASHKKDLTFSQFLESAGNVAKQTGKSAMLGGAVGTVSKMLPLGAAGSALTACLSAMRSAADLRLNREGSFIISSPAPVPAPPQASPPSWSAA